MKLVDRLIDRIADRVAEKVDARMALGTVRLNPPEFGNVTINRHYLARLSAQGPGA